MVAVNTLDALAKDETAVIRAARSVDRRKVPGKIIDATSFDEGFGGWRDHFNGTNPCNPLSLTAYPTMFGARSLQISAAAPAVATPGYLPSTNAAAFKNLSRFDETGKLTFAVWFTTKSQTFMGISEYAFLIDTQKWDDSTRSFYKVVLVRNASGAHNLRIVGDDDTLVGLTGSGALYGVNVGGYNDGKFNWNFLRLTVDLAANGGLGGYHSLQLNNQEWDLAGLGGSADHPPQSDGFPESFFSGGCNAGAYVSPGAAGSGVCSLYLNSPVFSIGEVG